MRRRESERRIERARGWLPVLLLLLGSAACGAGDQDGAGPAAAAPREDGALVSLLPGTAVEGWTASGEPETYCGEDLYLYINGGAEIYHEYGFRGVAVRDYADGAGRSISIEIFEMADAAAAFGIYTFKTSRSGEALDLGEQARLEGYYLNVRQGCYLLTLTGLDESDATVRGLTALAGSVVSRLGECGGMPPIASMLPASGLAADSLKYFRGTLGLFNSHRFFTDRAVFLREGVRGDYAAGYALFILAYESEAEALTHWTTLVEGFSGSPAYADVARAGDADLRADQPGDVAVRAARRGRWIVIARGGRGPVDRLDFDHLPGAAGAQ